MRSSRIYWLSGLILVGTIASGIWWAGGRSNAFEVLSARQGPILEVVYGLGTVTARKTFALKVGVTTNLKRALVTEGEFVKQGQPLIELDESGPQRAPFAGTITAVRAKDGEVVVPQVPILEMADLKDRYISVALEQQGALRVRAGQAARISFEGLESVTLKGSVRTVFPTENQFVVHIEVPELGEQILPGMTADVAIEVGQKENALLVPVNAIAAGQISLRREGRKLKVPVKLGIVDGQWAELLEGDVKATDEILARKP